MISFKCALEDLLAQATDLLEIYDPTTPTEPIPPIEATLLLLVPTVGLYKDVAGTIPATIAGDKVAAWKDMRNGLKFTQGSVANQPILAFVSGKPVVQFTEGQYLSLTNNFAGITVNSSAIMGFYTTDTQYTVFDGPNVTGTSLLRSGSDGKAYPGTFLGTNVLSTLNVPTDVKLVISLSRQEASYNGRINGVQLWSMASPALNNVGNLWTIGINTQIAANTQFRGDIFGIAIHSTPAGTSHADHVIGVAEIENHIDTFYIAPPPHVYIVNENFNATGAPAGWFTGGGANFDSATAPLEGTQQVRIGIGGYTVSPVMNEPSVWLKFRFRAFGLPASAVAFLNIQDSAFANLAVIVLHPTGHLEITGGVMTTDPIAAFSAYEIELRYTKGTGSNGIISLGFAASGGVIPSSGPKFVSYSASTSVNNVDHILFSSANVTNTDYDLVRISATQNP